jgi:hypothetical protein
MNSDSNLTLRDPSKHLDIPLHRKKIQITVAATNEAKDLLRSLSSYIVGLLIFLHNETET